MARRFRRGNRSHDADHAADEAVPPGAVLIGRSMAADGHSRDEIQEFLALNFRRIDVAATLDRVYEDSALSA